MSIQFTVAIPTYNGSSRIKEVLEALRSHKDLRSGAQTSTEVINWEIIVIDNNSNDNTKEVIEEYQKQWQLPVPIKYYFEPQQGLAFARQRAVKEAQGEFIGFLDDDNLPATCWVFQAYKFGQENPRAGAYSGQIHGDFEVKPPENFDKIAQFLAIRQHGNQAHLFEPEKLRLPPGAGLVIRRQAWLESVPNTPLLIGRVGKEVVAGEDYEVLLHMHKQGWEIWYNPQMQIKHKIPHQRLERSYLLPLARGIGLATCQLRMITAQNWQKPIILLRTILGNLRRLIWHFLQYRNQLKNNLIAAFELEFFIGSLLSPFYLLIKTTRRI